MYSRHPSRDVKQVVGNRSLECRGEVQARDVGLVTVLVPVLLEATSRGEIIKEVKVNRQEKRMRRGQQRRLGRGSQGVEKGEMNSLKCCVGAD